MPDLAHWNAFFAASIVLLLIPGPSVMYVVARGVDGGRRSVILSSVGLALGDFLQVCATAFGLSALLASSPAVMNGVRLAGAAYLILLGLATVLGTRGSKNSPSRGIGVRSSSGGLIGQGLLALNPKTALFFLALFPQFVVPSAGPSGLQMMLFGSAFVIFGFITNAIYGCLGGPFVGALVRRDVRFQSATRFVSGGTFMALGIVAALTAMPPAP
jgi:threonine/homoserine/homoserine lactone efflux protein